MWGCDPLLLPPYYPYLWEPREVANVFVLNPKRGLGFRYWTDRNALAGRPAVAVTDKVGGLLRLEMPAAFDRVDAPRRVEVPPGGGSTRTVFLIDCHGYRR